MWQFVSVCRYQTVCRYRCQGLAWTDGSDSGWVFCLVLDSFGPQYWIVQWRIIRNFCSEIVSSCVKMNVSLFLTNFTTELCPISFENFEVISEISKLTRQLFTYVVRWRVHELRLGVFQTIFGHWCTQHGVNSNLPPTSLRWWLPCLYFRSLAPVLVVLIRRKETANIRRNNFPLVHKQGPKITYIADGFLVFVILWLLTFT